MALLDAPKAFLKDVGFHVLKRDLRPVFPDNWIMSFGNDRDADLGWDAANACLRLGGSSSGPMIPVSFHIRSTDDADLRIFVANRNLRVMAIRFTPTTVDGAATTMTVRKVPDATAITSGVALHTGTFDLNAGANTVQAGTLTATSADRDFAAGDTLALDFSGALTNLMGVVTVDFALT